ncbi:MAG: FkbM family methyltransferase [Chloroflexi bacterium]|nr:FkbM family methyltransferase [Chloroflexota bacterium]
MLSFDDIVNRAFADSPIIDLCKVDVEGSEHEVFLGTECSTVNRIRYLIIEIHPLPTYSPEMLIKRLQELGFEDISPKVRPEQAVFLFKNRALSIR